MISIVLSSGSNTLSKLAVSAISNINSITDMMTSVEPTTEMFHGKQNDVLM